MSPSSQMPYRPEIDGLRAIAVLSVVLYHFGVPLRGGFIGVDVFFVISGFLIGGILWRELKATGSIRIGAFYMRRFRRLAPAFFAMLFAVLAVGWVILLPFEYRELGKSAIAATVYLSNVLFFRSAGYFDTLSEEKPLLHTWSLAVEEQFYIVLPLLLILLVRMSGRVPAILAGLAALSLIGCIWLTPSMPTATFYLFPFRAWELLAGVLLAIFLAERPAHALPSLVSYIGLLLVLVSVLIIPAGGAFPGAWALMPVVGTVLLLANVTSANGVNRGLAHPLPVFFGKISYSLYLWHWPVFVLALYYRAEFASPLETLGWLTVAFLLSVLSWRFVERPVREARALSARAVVGGTAVATVGALALAGMIFKNDGLQTRFSDEAQVHIAASADFLQDWSRCEIAPDGPFAGLELCPIGPEGTPEVLIWGDSHVRALREGLDLASLEAGVPGVIIWRAGCPPFFGIEKEETAATPAQNRACGDANRQIEVAMTEMDQFQSVLLVGRWAYYWNGQGVGRDAVNEIRVWASSAPDQNQQEALTQTARDTVAKLGAGGAQVFVFQQPPEVENYDSRHAARAFALKHLPGSVVDEVAQDVARADVERRQGTANSLWEGLSAGGAIKALQSWDAFCVEGSCNAVIDGVGQYFDNNHLTNLAALRIRAVFAPLFEATRP